MRRTLQVLISLFPGLVFCLASQVQSQTANAASKDETAQYPANQAGILIQGSQGAEAEWTPIANQYPAKVKAAGVFAASLSYGLVPAKVMAEFSGEQAPTRSGSDQPLICVCHFTSLPGAPALVRLHPKKGVRKLDGGRMIVYPIVGGSKTADANASDVLPADVSHPEPTVWLVHSKLHLEPGEYALMLGTQNVSIFPFSVRPVPTHENSVK